MASRRTWSLRANPTPSPRNTPRPGTAIGSSSPRAFLKLWGEFEISDSAPRLAADVRAVAECLRDGEEPSTGLPARFLLTFSPQQVAALSEYVDGAALPILRWRPDRSVEPLEVAQSREWHAEDDAD